MTQKNRSGLIRKSRIGRNTNANLHSGNAVFDLDNFDDKINPTPDRKDGEMLGSIMVLIGIFVFIQFATINNISGNIGNVITMMTVILLLSFGGLLARRDL